MRKVRTNFDKVMWTPEDVAKLRELAPTHTAREIASIMGRSYPSVRAKMQREGIEATSEQNWNAWSFEEMTFLEEHHETMPVAEMAKALKRTEASIKKKCWALGMSILRKKYSDEDVRLCRALFAEGVSRQDIAEKLEVPYERVITWLLGRSRNNV